MTSIISDLNEGNYFSPENQLMYTGSSQFKSFQSCPAAAMAELRGEYRQEQTTALLVGSYVDNFFSGTLDVFRAKNPDLFSRDGTLKAPYRQAEDIIRRIERDEMFMKYLSGQPQVIMTGEIESVPIKIKIDSYHPGKCIVDLKIMRDMQDVWKDGQKMEFWEAWGYGIQGSIYREIVRQNTGDTLPFVMAIATKEKPEPDIDIKKIADSRLDYDLENVKALIEHFQAVKKGIEDPEKCGICPYCRSVKILTEITEVG